MASSLTKYNEKLAALTRVVNSMTNASPEEIRFRVLELLVSLDVKTREEKRLIHRWIDNRGYAVDIGMAPDLFILEYEKAYQKKIQQEEKAFLLYRIEEIEKSTLSMFDNFLSGKIDAKALTTKINDVSTRLTSLISGSDEPKPLSNREIDKQEEREGLFINLLNLYFQFGTVIYIGGRPGDGKTLVMNCIAVELLTRGFSVEFYTYEESAKRLFYKLLICTYFQRMKNNGRMANLLFPRERPWEPYGTPLKSLIGSAVKKVFPPAFLQEDREFLREKIDSGKLKIYDRPGDIRQLAGLMGANPQAVAFLDYIQKVPAQSDHVYLNRQAQIQYISGLLLDMVVKSGKMLIAGAQFNRMNDKLTRNKLDGKGYPDVSDYSLDKFREAGDIEQDANIALGIKSVPCDQDSRKCSVKVLKNRDDRSGNIIHLEHHALFWSLERMNTSGEHTGDRSRDHWQGEELL